MRLNELLAYVHMRKMCRYALLAYIHFVRLKEPLVYIHMEKELLAYLPIYMNTELLTHIAWPRRACMHACVHACMHACVYVCIACMRARIHS